MTAAEEAAMKLEQFYQQHEQDARRQLATIVTDVQDTAFADRASYHYYSDGGNEARWFWMSSPKDIAMADALDSLIHVKAQEMGFSEQLFFLPDIDNGLAAMHQPDSVENPAEQTAQLELSLTRAYLRYTVGQRFGFVTTQQKLFGAKNYDIENEAADSTFINLAMSKLSDKQTMLDFLNSSISLPSIPPTRPASAHCAIWNAFAGATRSIRRLQSDISSSTLPHSRYGPSLPTPSSTCASAAEKHRQNRRCSQVK